MKRTSDLDRVASAAVRRPPGVVLKGQFTEVLRSAKGKLKGIYLRSDTETYAVKLPKYLRPMLVRELVPGTFVQVWAYFDEEKWRGLNLLPLPEDEAIALQETWQLSTPSPTAAVSAVAALLPTDSVSQSPKPLCVKVCRKGSCFKQGGRKIMQSLAAEIAADPTLQHVSVEGVGCLKACKRGPNLKLSNSKKVITGVTPNKALDLVRKHA
ncbi:MAG: (2Fe-2S) ferredoxin domain-containing protein [Leptolyngbya sp. SIOISBB]|nr:(2Fe-2S) ferredoxin domain-containing protein [Leptolyngbya sp. SIOISBB]